MILLIMGVAGCGKTTVGEGLARELGWAFQEGDALHPAANVAKMAGGTPLTDEDRWPWLAAIAARMQRWRAEGVSGVATCSALKRSYRAMLPADRLVYLRGSEALIAERLAARRGHFMPPALLASQFLALEEPGAEEEALVVDIGPPAAAIVRAVVSVVGGGGKR